MRGWMKECGGELGNVSVNEGMRGCLGLTKTRCLCITKTKCPTATKKLFFGPGCHRMFSNWNDELTT